MSLAHYPVAFVLISVIAFWYRVSHGFRPREKFGLKARFEGKSWPKVAVGGKAMIFLCFGGKSSVVLWLFRFTVIQFTVIQVYLIRSE